MHRVGGLILLPNRLVHPGAALLPVQAPTSLPATLDSLARTPQVGVVAGTTIQVVAVMVAVGTITEAVQEAAVGLEVETIMAGEEATPAVEGATAGTAGELSSLSVGELGCWASDTGRGIAEII